MQTMAERAAQRRKKATLNIVSLHSNDHHSFHLHLSLKDSWELLAKMSQDTWREETGQTPPSRVDKSIYKFISQRK